MMKTMEHKVNVIEYLMYEYIIKMDAKEYPLLYYMQFE